ncbi:hypothetical protein ACSTH1_23670, partial [Vibrio parahaemolyticus]
MKKTCILFLALTLFVSSCLAQVLVNRDWVDVSGETNATYISQASCFDADGNLITVGNVLHANQAENMLISKF